MASQRLTVFLLKDVDGFDEALDLEEGTDVFEADVSPDAGMEGKFYSKASKVDPPGWLSYLAPVLDGPPDDLRSASASGLLLLRVDGDVFALTFGYGRSLLNQSKIVRRFGLKVVLNLIDDRGIRSLDTKVFDEIVVSRNTQSSRSSDLPTFGIDVLRDILRAATGKPPEGTGYKTLSGSDALVLSSNTAAENLPEVLRALRLHYGSTKYRDSFGWVDHLNEVKDSEMKGFLDGEMLKRLLDGNLEDTHMAIPDNLDAGDIEHFTITGSRGKEYEELDLAEYIADVGTAGLSVETLQQRKVSVRFLGAPNPTTRSSIYQCLISEQRYDDSLFVLIEGRWYEVADTLVAQVDDYVGQLGTSAVSLVPARPGESEDSYNERAADSNPALVKLDGKLVSAEGAVSKIEFCDLLGTDGSLIHVKRKVRSSTLSHLFAQGRVSAGTLGDGAAREGVRKAISAAATLSEGMKWLNVVPPADVSVDRSQYKIVYAVIANSDKPGNEWLPFFSRLNLMQSAQMLNRSGFARVEVMRIPIQP